MTEQEMVNAQASLDELTRIRDDERYFDMRGDAVEDGIQHLRKALAALQRVRTALIVNSYEMNSWSKAVSVDDILTALNGTEAIKP